MRIVAFLLILAYKFIFDNDFFPPYNNDVIHLKQKYV